MEKEKRKELLRALKFLLFSISAGVIDMGSFALLSLIIPYAWINTTIATILSVVWNFTFNRRFTFKSASNVPIAMLKVAIYYAVFIPVAYGLTFWLVGTLGWNEFLVKVINMVINFVTEFLYQRFFVFKDSIDTNKAAQEEAAKENGQDNDSAKDE